MQAITVSSFASKRNEINCHKSLVYQIWYATKTNLLFTPRQKKMVP